MYTEGAKKCIHILRDVIFVKCVYIFWHPLYIYIYMYRGCQKMYTHFKRCYLCKMCIHFFWHPLYITRLASNEIFSPSNKIHREVGQAKDLSAPR